LDQPLGKKVKKRGPLWKRNKGGDSGGKKNTSRELGKTWRLTYREGKIRGDWHGFGIRRMGFGVAENYRKKKRSG